MSYSHGIPSKCRFIAVIGEDGTFYDLVNLSQVTKHLHLMQADGYQAHVVRRDLVPPCQFRDFANGDGATYQDATWKGGGDFYFVS